MHASTPHILRKSRMRRRACTDLRGGRSAMVVPTATIIDSQFLVCRQAGRNYSRGHLALAIAELVDTEFFDPKLNGRSGETELFRGAVFPRYSAPRCRKGIFNRLPFF